MPRDRLPGDKRRSFSDEQDCPWRVASARNSGKAFAVCGLAPQLPEWWLDFNLEYCWPLYDFEKLAALDHMEVVSVEDLSTKILVLVDNLLDAHAIRNRADDVGDRHAHTANARTSPIMPPLKCKPYSNRAMLLRQTPRIEIPIRYAAVICRFGVGRVLMAFLMLIKFLSALPASASR
jgi:hypothetical protein